MNYGKKKAAKRQKQITSKSAMQAKRVGVRLFKALLLCIIVVAIAGVAGGGLFVKKIIDNSPDITPDDVKPQGFTTLVYADDGTTEIERFVAAGSNRVYKTIDEIPADLQHAFVAIEDERFYEHNGIDIKGIIRAAYVGISNGFHFTEGASTITQQLARTVFLSNEKTWERKIEEMYIAVELEKKYTKEDILEFYLNNVYFANGYYGIEAAAQGYFGTDVSHLSLSQMIYLCAIPNNPTLYNPLTNPDKTEARRDRILKSMLEDKVISENSYETAKAEKIETVQKDEIKNNYAETFTYYCATRALMELEGFEFQTVFSDDAEKEAYDREYQTLYDECNAKLFTGGYRIYTSLDLEAQSRLQASIDYILGGFDEKNDEGIYTLQGASVCIDNTTGMVRAIVGGRSQDDVEGYTLNRAFQSFRQPGSAIKPLIVYTPALERGYTPDTIVVDEPIENGPVNGDGTYSGAMTLRQAVALSKNTIAWKIFEEITPEVGISYLESMQFSNLDANDKRLPASVGGFTNGVSALEMAKGYATIKNDGGYRNPTCIIKITDADGQVLYQADQTASVVYKENACRQMTDMLQTVITSGTGRGYSLGNMPCAGKTGTTNDNKDGWFVGYTPYYTTSVWVGYDIPKEVPGLGGGTYPGKIWYAFMSWLHEGLEPIDFVHPLDQTLTDLGQTNTTENALPETGE